MVKYSGTPSTAVLLVLVLLLVAAPSALKLPREAPRCLILPNFVFLRGVFYIIDSRCLLVHGELRVASGKCLSVCSHAYL